MSNEESQGLAAAEGPVLTSAEALQSVSAEWPRMRGRWIVKPQPDGWVGYAISEWELAAAGFSDLHPHDEVAFVLAGELHIEANGREVVGRAGDSIRVPAGSIGRYWAPQYARMMGVYGPNPNCAKSDYLEYWEIDSPGV